MTAEHELARELKRKIAARLHELEHTGYDLCLNCGHLEPLPILEVTFRFTAEPLRRFCSSCCSDRIDRTEPSQ